MKEQRKSQVKNVILSVLDRQCYCSSMPRTQSPTHK
jgi:hypothetical protein